MNNMPASLPPGQHPLDPSRAEIDPVLFALERLQTHLIWIVEHQSSAEQLRYSDPFGAENELEYLRNSTNQCILHLQRLIELVLANCNPDPQKRRPKGLNNELWLHLVQFVEKEQKWTSDGVSDEKSR